MATHITKSAAGSFGDENILILTPSQQPLPVYTNNDGWISPGPGQTLRCNAEGAQITSMPVPMGFVVPGSTTNSTPNNASATLMQDARTLRQMQPFTKCQNYGYATALATTIDQDIYGGGILGSHGGSGLSSIGGTIRLGELLSNSPPIAHALQLVLNNSELSPQYNGMRWPAVNADGNGSTYSGQTRALRMGSLVALRPGLNINALQTVPARRIAQALTDYGAYVVDTTGGWSAYYFTYENSTNGSVKNEMMSNYGYSWNNVSNPNQPFSSDMNLIMANLSVIDNWNQSLFNTVSQSAGAQGAGGGAPRQPWAPAISD